jgi:carbon monoxide dehydrogenase subunit G
MAENKFDMEGAETFPAPPDRVFDLLTNVECLARTIPDLVSSEKVDDHTLKCVVKAGVPFLKGNQKLEIRLFDLVPPKRATMQVASQGIGASMTIRSHLELRESGDGTRLEWKTQVMDMKGLVATVSPSLVKAAATQVIRRGWSNIRNEIKDSDG